MFTFVVTKKHLNFKIKKVWQKKVLKEQKPNRIY
jgi:hypothetical protein